jgi:hypothetical protein
MASEKPQFVAFRGIVRHGFSLELALYRVDFQAVRNEDDFLKQAHRFGEVVHVPKKYGYKIYRLSDN